MSNGQYQVRVIRNVNKLDTKVNCVSEQQAMFNRVKLFLNIIDEIHENVCWFLKQKGRGKRMKYAEM